MEGAPETMSKMTTEVQSEGTKDPSDAPKVSLDDLMGIAKYKGPPKSLQHMEDGIAQGALESMKHC